jgi:hypothetical protein
VYSAILAHIAATSSESVKAVTLGLSIGNVVGDRVGVIVKSISNGLKTRGTSTELTVSDEDLNKWTVTIIHSTSKIVGVIASFVMKRAAAIFSGCMLGAQMFVRALESVVDPLLEQAKLPTLAKNPEVITALQMSLVGLGFVTQMKGSKHIPAVIKALLAPFFAADLAITALMVGKEK